MERLEKIKRRTLLIGLGVTLPFALLHSLSTGASAPKTAWLLGFAATIGWMSLGRPARWKLCGLGVAAVVMAPVVCTMDPVGPVEIATLFLVPILVGVLFIDAFEVVWVVGLSGWLANAIFFGSLGWPFIDLAVVLVVSGSSIAGVVMAAAGAQKLRELDRDSETQHSQALRLSESRRAQAERLAIVGRLASGVAHEINNPLAFVKANVGALRRSLLQGDDPMTEEELEELLEDTTQGIERICQIVGDLKGFSREDSGSVEPVDLHEVITGAVRLATVRLPRDVKVSVEVPHGLPFARASQRKLSQVLLNLLVNAGEALEEARTVTPTVTIRAARQLDLLTLTITDNGPGIPSAVAARLFEPFFTTKPAGKGTGLGLALSREYVEAFGGTLGFQNVEPHGAQFCITMKIAEVTGETVLPSRMFEVDSGPMLIRRHTAPSPGPR